MISTLTGIFSLQDPGSTKNPVPVNMKSDTLSSLPPELICMILGRLRTPRDLYSIIRASPRIYTGAFTGSRETILRDVAQNAFNPTALPDALMAVRFLESDNPSTSESGDKQQRLVYLARLMGEAKTMQHTYLTLDECMALCKLFYSFEFFARDCSGLFLGHAQFEVGRKWEAEVDQTVNSRYSKCYSSLSSVELSRLQRGFLRYITLQNLMHTPEIPLDVEKLISYEEVATLFVNYTPWEIEEIACVHHYIVERLKSIFDEVEDDFVDIVASTEQPSTSRYLPYDGDKSADLDSIEAESPFMCYSPDDIEPDGDPSEPASCDTADSSAHMFLESQKKQHPFIIEHLAALGFNFFRKFVEADNRRRRSMIHANYVGNLSGIDEALEDGPRPETEFFREEREGRQRSRKLKFEGDEHQKRNLGWLWANQMEPQSNYYETCKIDLRAWGYVFWDSDRLEHLGILNEPRPFLYRYQYPPHYRKPKIRPSAQRRLREMGLA